MTALVLVATGMWFFVSGLEQLTPRRSAPPMPLVGADGRPVPGPPATRPVAGTALVLSGAAGFAEGLMTLAGVA